MLTAGYSDIISISEERLGIYPG